MANKLQKTKKNDGLIAKTQKQEINDGDKELFYEVKTAYEDVYGDNYREKVPMDMVP